MGNDVHDTKAAAACESFGHLMCCRLRGVEYDSFDFRTQLG